MKKGMMGSIFDYMGEDEKTGSSRSGIGIYFIPLAVLIVLISALAAHRIRNREKR